MDLQSNNTMSTKDTFEMSGPLAHMKPPHPTASVDEKLDFIDVQLNSFGKETVLTLYECLGASERRRGGMCCCCSSLTNVTSGFHVDRVVIFSSIAAVFDAAWFQLVQN